MIPHATRKANPKVSNGRLLRRLAPLVAYALLGATAVGQGAPLADALRGKFDSEHVAAMILQPSSNAADANILYAITTFDTDARTLTLDWHFRAAGAEPGHQLDVHTLSYEPTAVCKRADLGPTFYVAGYYQRTGHTVVEEWTVQDMALGSAQPPGGGAAQSTFAKTITKRVVLLSTAVHPLKAIIYHRTQAKLWLFEEEAPSAVFTVNPDDEAPSAQWYFDATVVPQLAAAHNAHTFKVKNTATDGGGVVVVLYPWRAWSPKWATPSTLTGAENLYLFRDQNLDGIIDESTGMTWNNQVLTRLYFENLDTTVQQ